MMIFAAAFIGDVYYFQEEMGAYRNSPMSLMNTRRNYVCESITNIWIYVSCAYLRGLSKKENIWNDIFIKHKIMRRAIVLLKDGENRDFLYNVIKIKKTMVLYFFPSLVALWLGKLKKKIQDQLCQSGGYNN